MRLAEDEAKNTNNMSFHQQWSGCFKFAELEVSLSSETAPKVKFSDFADQPPLIHLR